MGAPEVTAFLTHLALRRNVAASTQNQALHAILFLYRHVLKFKLPWLEEMQRAKKPQHLPVVFTRQEVRALLGQLQGTLWLMATLIYGSGLRLLECLRLRVKDLDFQGRQILVRDAKGQKDRVTMLPATLIEPFRMHPLYRSAIRNRATPSRGGGRSATRSEAGHPQIRNRKARQRALVKTTLYTHVPNRGGRGVVSPADMQG